MNILQEAHIIYMGNGVVKQNASQRCIHLSSKKVPERNRNSEEESEDDSNDRQQICNFSFEGDTQCRTKNRLFALKIKIPSLIQYKESKYWKHISIDKKQISQYNYIMEKDITVFKSQVCHTLKEMGDVEFMLDVIKIDRIRIAWDNESYFEAFYYLGMLDYLSRLHSIPLCSRYDDIRSRKLSKPIYPTGILLMEKTTKEQMRPAPIAEFQNYNIYEYDVRDVC